MPRVQQWLLLQLLLAPIVSSSGAVHSVFGFGAAGDGAANDTAAIQRTLDAAAASGRGSVAWLPGNGTFRLGGALHLLGHAYDGVSLTVDGAVTIPTPAWSTPAQAGLVNNASGVRGLGFPGTLASGVLTVINVDGFRFNGAGSFTGYLFVSWGAARQSCASLLAVFCVLVRCHSIWAGCVQGLRLDRRLRAGRAQVRRDQGLPEAMPAQRLRHGQLH